MVSLLIYDKDPKESKCLSDRARDVVAHLSDDRLQVESFQESRSLGDYLSGRNLMDMAFLDVTIKDGVPVAVKIRRSNQEAELLLLADASVSPMKYLNPSIRASSLLLRPYSRTQGEEVIGEFIQSFYRSRTEESDKDIFVLETKNGRMTIPYSKIYYLEVREKRVYVRLKNAEYFRYGTLTQVMEDLPEDHFIRCHRSFVVNKTMIRQVRLTEGILCLSDGLEIPLSRSYKGAVREYLNELRKQ